MVCLTDSIKLYVISPNKEISMDNASLITKVLLRYKHKDIHELFDMILKRSELLRLQEAARKRVSRFKLLISRRFVVVVGKASYGFTNPYFLKRYLINIGADITIKTPLNVILCSSSLNTDKHEPISISTDYTNANPCEKDLSTYRRVVKEKDVIDKRLKAFTRKTTLRRKELTKILKTYLIISNNRIFGVIIGRNKENEAEQCYITLKEIVDFMEVKKTEDLPKNTRSPR